MDGLDAKFHDIELSAIVTGKAGKLCFCISLPALNKHKDTVKVWKPLLFQKDEMGMSPFTCFLRI
ncbi:hypothetical protein D7V94_17810 [Parablautia intestinalis]|jgi:hypothetical protein|uniref:Uncharacterized protein n=1 Tax=Parablautia intestinalis TaxID=2320100 RepID=A0A3A9APK7_9FIRM|nr:hypothetical protein D7V94_17810 [Parablautia intestinalis]